MQEITDALMPEYSIRKMTLETSSGDWEAYRRLALNALPLTENQQAVGVRDLARLTGRYWHHDGAGACYCDILLEDERLMVRGSEPQLVGFFFADPSRELIPIDTHHFYAGISPVVVTFIEAAAGAIEELRVDFTRLGGGGVRGWIKERR